MDNYITVFVTAPNKDVGEKIASVLLEKKLVACVNIVDNITSMYWWKGKLCKDNECFLMMKTIAGNFNKVKETVLEHHPYEVPEIISIKIKDGHVDYLDWIKHSCK
ncbi:MAG: divalent-cation tolerance protein CutA [Pseudomonadota bacterium]